MTDTIGWKIDVAKIKAQLQHLPDHAYQQAMLNETAKAFKEQIRVNAPKKTGEYSQSWKITKVVSTKIRAETKLGVMYNWLEFKGTKPHDILPRKKKALRWFGKHSDKSAIGLSSGFFGTDRSATAGISHDNPIFAQKVRHPGTKPQPHTRPAIKHIVAQIPKILYRDLGKANELFRQDAKKFDGANFNIKRTVTRKTGRKRLSRKRAARVKIDR